MPEKRTALAVRSLASSGRWRLGGAHVAVLRFRNAPATLARGDRRRLARMNSATMAFFNRQPKLRSEKLDGRIPIASFDVWSKISRSIRMNGVDLAETGRYGPRPMGSIKG